VDARRDNVADRNYGNNKNRYHARYSLLTLTRTARSPGTAFHTGRVPRSGERVGHRRRYRGWISPPVLAHLHRVNHSDRICEVILTRWLPQ
jgi:hypothetical protein